MSKPAAKNKPAPLEPPAADKKTPGASSSRKVLKILTYFEPGRTHARVEELAAFVEVPKSTAYRYISLLRETGLLAVDGQGRWHLAPKVIRMAAAARAAVGFLDVAAPFMERLSNATQETVLLIERIGDSGTCVAKHDSTQMVRLSFEVGTSVALHRGAGAKLLLAYLSEEEQDRYLASAAKLYTNLRGRIPELRAQLKDIRRHGVAVSESDLVQDLWSIAAPITQGEMVVASVSLVGPLYRMQKSQKKHLEQLVRETAAGISATLDERTTP